MSWSSIYRLTFMSQEFRVFISSTFRDLHVEREHLVKKVFPEIRARCRERGVSFTEVDLRWGITDDDVTSGRVVRTCLNEIDRTSPYFIGITGDRYGYIPTEADFESDPELAREFPVVETAISEGASITDLEFRYGVLDALKHRKETPRAFFYFKDPELRASAKNTQDDRDKLAALEERVRSLKFPVHEYGSAEMLGEQVKADLLDVLDRDFAESRPPRPLEAERIKHLAFSASRRHTYLPNDRDIATLNAFADSDDQPVVIVGGSGSGKSSLAAYWAERYRVEHPDAHVIEHYIGAGAGTTDQVAVMRHLMDEIKERFRRSEALPGDAMQLEREFTNWLGFTEGKRVVIVIDALDQLSGAGAGLAWLPSVWPANIRLVVSTLSEETARNLSDRGLSMLRVYPLTESERRKIISQFLRSYGKALAPTEIDRIALDEKSAHPLFLRTLLEELRIYGTHETLHDRVTRCLNTSGTDDLFQVVLERMEVDFGAAQVRMLLSALWASRTGVAPGELVEILGLSRLDVSLTTRSLDYHLLQRDGLLGFFHNYLRRAVEARYLASDTEKQQIHEQLAGYYERTLLAAATDVIAHPLVASSVSVRLAQEASYQLRTIEAYERLATVLGSIPVYLALHKNDRTELLEMWRTLSDEGYEPVGTYTAALAELRSADSPLLPATLLALYDLIEVRGDYATAEALLKEILALPDETSKKSQKLRALTLLGKLSERRSEIQQALDYYELVVSEARDASSVAVLAMATRGLVTVHMQQARYADAKRYSDQLFSLYDSIGDRDGFARTLLDQGQIFWHQGQHDQAMTRYQEALSYYRSISSKTGIMHSLGNIGRVYAMQLRPQDALRHHQQCLEIAESLGDKYEILGAMTNVAQALAVAGDFDEALASNYRQLELADSIGHKKAAMVALNSISVIEKERGQVEAAYQKLLRATELARETGYKFGLTYILANLAHTILRRSTPDLEEAQRVAEELISLAHEISLVEFVFRGEAVLSDIFQHQGKRLEANELLHRTLQRALSMDDLERIADAYARL
jgi:nephrocystin-3